MAGNTNPAINNHTVADSPHVMAFTNVDRGDTPAVWDAVEAPTRTGVWVGVDNESGPADLNGNATGDFETGPGRWRQT